MAIPNKSSLKILEKMEGGHIQELSNFWVPPIISGTGKAMDFKFGQYIYRFTGPIRIKAHKILEKRERWCIQGLSKFLGTPYFSETGKATDFKFCGNIHGVDWNKSP